ncbi:MAG: ABC transporter substrate-binding protein [Chloroflexi bacterium]|nr:ABC transporter substrate-binding protein [Chloroflexota bacterium]
MGSDYWSTFWLRKLTRRRLLGSAAAAGGGLAAAAVLGCKAGTPSTARKPVSGSPAAGAPSAGGVLREGRPFPVTGLDPHIDIFGLDILPQIYSRLYTRTGRVGHEKIVFDNLATKLETPDHLTFIFTLRPGVKYHPIEPIAGLEVTAEDVQASFIRRSTAITAIDKRFSSLIEKTEVNGNVFKLVIKRPFVPALLEMGNPTWGIIPKQIAEQYPGGGLSDKDFGSGPFMIDSFVGSERIALKKHPDFFVPDRPLLDGHDWIIIQDNSSLLAAFRSGAHDINGSVLDKRTAEDLQQDQGVVVNKYPDLFYPVILLKVSKPPFSDIRVREALDLAIDREALIARINDGEGKYNGPVQWGQERFSLPQEELRQLMPHDTGRAKSLLKEAGYGQLNLTLQLPLVPGPAVVADTANVIQQQLAAANINVELRTVELGAFLTTVLLPGNFDIAFFPQLPYAEPDRPLSFYHTNGVTGQGNATGLNRTFAASHQAGFSLEVDELIDRQQREFDEQARRQLILDAQRKIIREHGPQITLTGGYAYSALRDYVKGASPTAFDPSSGLPSIFTWDIWLDKA